MPALTRNRGPGELPPGKPEHLGGGKRLTSVEVCGARVRSPQVLTLGRASAT